MWSSRHAVQPGRGCRDAIRCCRPDMPSSQDEDVGDQPGHRRLAVRSRDRHDRNPPIRVADPGGRRRPGFAYPLGPARDKASLGTGQLRRSRRRDIALGQGQRGLGQQPRPFLACPGEGHDPVPGVRRAMDRQAAPPLAVIDPQAADPGDDRRDGVRSLLHRNVRAEVHEGMATRVTLAIPGPPAPDGDLDLDHRLEPVDVRSLEEADLDQSHGQGRIASAPAA